MGGNIQTHGDFQVQLLRRPKSIGQLCGMVAFDCGDRQDLQYAIHFAPYLKTVVAREPSSRGYRRCVASLAGRDDAGGAFVALQDADFICLHGPLPKLTNHRISERATRYVQSKVCPFPTDDNQAICGFSLLRAWWALANEQAKLFDPELRVPTSSTHVSQGFAPRRQSRSHRWPSFLSERVQATAAQC